MNAKTYYLTTLGDWQRHAAAFANSHWLALDEINHADVAAPQTTMASDNSSPMGAQPDAAIERHVTARPARTLSDATRILLLVEADEGAHLALEDDAAFEPLPHPLAQRPVSAAAQAALAQLGVAPGATTFEAAEAAARLHPLLRHRVF